MHPAGWEGKLGSCTTKPAGWCNSGHVSAQPAGQEGGRHHHVLASFSTGLLQRSCLAAPTRSPCPMCCPASSLYIRGFAAGGREAPLDMPVERLHAAVVPGNENMEQCGRPGQSRLQGCGMICTCRGQGPAVGCKQVGQQRHTPSDPPRTRQPAAQPHRVLLVRRFSMPGLRMCSCTPRLHASRQASSQVWLGTEAQVGVSLACGWAFPGTSASSRGTLLIAAFMLAYGPGTAGPAGATAHLSLLTAGPGTVGSAGTAAAPLWGRAACYAWPHRPLA